MGSLELNIAQNLYIPVIKWLQPNQKFLFWAKKYALQINKQSSNMSHIC